MTEQALNLLNSDYGQKYGFRDPEQYVRKFDRGLTRQAVQEISSLKNEPEWMRNFRLKSLEIFFRKKMPAWGADLSHINFDDIVYYLSPTERKSASWDDVPANIKSTFEKLGIPEAERRFLGGVGAQYDSETVYHKLRKDLEEKGIIFTDTDTALKEHEGIFRKYFGTIVPPQDNKFSALNSAVWSGGSFIYIPKGVKVDVPLQAYFRINAKNMGQFERTLIIADEGSSVNYVEGCTAPIYSSDSLHAAVVELIALKNARIRYTTIQNWSGNVYNLVTKRAYAHEHAVVEWIDGNLGSKATMKYPSVYLMGRNAKADILSVAFAGKGQHQDAGGKAYHFAPDTTSTIISKSISRDGGRTSYRGLLHVEKGAENVKSSVRCDALILDEESRSDTYPVMEIDEENVTITHEATVGKIGEDQIFYLMSRGLTEQQAVTMIVLGFVEQFTKELPMEYAIELNRLIQLEMTGSVG
ncbi:Fe-S cluster assembly protein SufB [Candidatus Woesearchaeota archaeon]|nr:Fe-S cluster assembly protein SufB [Candidatus Woesearchaeota archaeon]